MIFYEFHCYKIIPVCGVHCVDENGFNGTVFPIHITAMPPNGNVPTYQETRHLDEQDHKPDTMTDMPNTTSTTIPLNFLPFSLTNNGEFFLHRHMAIFDPWLSGIPYPQLAEEMILAGLYNYSDFTMLNTIPSNFDIRYDFQQRMRAQLVNPPPTLNRILFESVQNPTTRTIYKIILSADRVPISGSDLLFHPRYGVGVAQGLAAQSGHFVQLLTTFRDHTDAGGLVTFVAVWIHHSHVQLNTRAEEFLWELTDNRPESDFALARESTNQITFTEYAICGIITTDQPMS